MQAMNNESRVEKHIVKSSNQYFPILMNFCAFSKIYIITLTILSDRNLLIMEIG